MKPGFIFSAVFVVSLLMAVGLPQLMITSSANAGTAPLTSQSQPPAVEEQPVAEGQPAAEELPVAEKLPAVDQSSAAAQAPTPAQRLVDSQPGAEQLPSPAPTAMVTAAQAASLQDGIPLTSIAQNSPELLSFISTVINNQADQVVGVYVPGVFALPILQQPAGDMNYITPFDGALTQYAPPLENNVISLLAHNFLAGRGFFHLETGSVVTIVYGDGRLANYQVSTIDRYQALSPLDPYSDFVDQADPSGTVQSFQQVYDRYYKASGYLVFQTCIERNGDLSWGRIFVVAQPE